VLVTVEVFPPERETECFLVATRNKKGWLESGDGITACAAVARCDFDFRYDVFGGFFSKGHRYANRWLTQNSWNTMALALREDAAVYFINEEQVHSVEIPPRVLPTTTPCLGVYGFTTAYRAKHFAVRALRPQVLTLLPFPKSTKDKERSARVSVANVAGRSCKRKNPTLPDKESSAPVSVTNMAGKEICQLSDQAWTAVSAYKAVADKVGVSPLITLPGLQTLYLVRRDGSMIDCSETPLESLGLDC